MNFLIISQVVHQSEQGKYYAYEPYVREMNIWLKQVDKVEVVAPMINKSLTAIDSAYQHQTISFIEVPQIQFTSILYAIRSIFKLPTILLRTIRACRRADHIHLRCPGNIGLLGCIVQLFFPSKPKTAKYAGNWDPKAKQPLSYKLQRWILSNTWLTKNMSILVYGDWKDRSKNVKPFFTASFSDSDIINPEKRNYSQKLNILFVGSLVEGKRPDLAIKIIKNLKLQQKLHLDLYGEGPMDTELVDYVNENNLKNSITFHGSVDLSTLKKAYRKAHFLILPSKSEGWPKAISEAMFYGVIPIATRISCVPYMLGHGERGILISSDHKSAVKTIEQTINGKDLKKISTMAASWSQKFTLEYFESEIIKILKL